MRGRSIRLTILIVLIFALSVATLGFREININIPGFPALERGGTGPLGLRLGLDLLGGAHLVYQADVGTRVQATFDQPVVESEVREILEGLDLTAQELGVSNATSLSIKTSLLDVSVRQSLRDALEERFGPAQTFQATDTPNPTADQMEGVVDIINRRVNLFGTEDPIVQQFGDDRVIVQLPGASGSVTDVRFAQDVTDSQLNLAVWAAGFDDSTIEQRGDNSFRIHTISLGPEQQASLRDALADEFGTIESFRVTGGIEAAKALIGETARLEFKERTCGSLGPGGECLNFTDSDLGLTGDDLVDAFAATDQLGRWVVNIQFDSRGSQIFSDLTQRIAQNPNYRIAVFLDDELIIAPVSQAWIRTGASQITGGFTREEARALAIQLDSGRLPVPLLLIQESEVDALLGAASLERSLVAGMLGLGLVMVFMMAYYRMGGVVASVALIFYAAVLLAVFKLIPITLTLPHIGGFILSVGMAVDANILIFERMKEELRVGRTLASAMEVGFSRAWPAIRDGNVTTMITCGVLLWFGNQMGGGLINGFALSLLIGVIISMFTAVVLSRNLLQLLAWMGFSRRANLFTPEGIPGGARPTSGRTQTAGGR
jgi:preprotein translocase subunit SecD